MPSLLVAWAAVVAFGALAASTSRWRWLGMAHLVLTRLVISATGHHWWLDGIVALALLWVALQLDTLGRRAAGSVRAALAATSPGVRPLDGALPERVEGLQPALAEDEAT